MPETTTTAVNGDAQAPDNQMGSFLDIDTSAVPDVKVLPEGEYLIGITSATQGLSSKQNPMITTVWEVPDEPLVEDMYNYCNLPAAGQNEKTQFRNMRSLKEWKTSLGLPQQGQINLEELVASGLRCYANLVIEEYQGRKRNKIKNIIRPA
jgi:hypothetical protein